MASLSTSLPAELKAIKPFILRGAEVEKYALSSGVPEQRRVAYYCFMHAMEKAVESAHSQEPAVSLWRFPCNALKLHGFVNARRFKII